MGGTMDERIHARRIVRSGRRPLAHWGHRTRLARAFAIAALITAAMPNRGQAADEALHEITWLHSSPSLVQGFVIFVSPVDGSIESARRLEVGKPRVNRVGTSEMYSTIVDIHPTEYLAIGAVGYNGALSGLSSWRSAPPSRPGQPLVVEP